MNFNTSSLLNLNLDDTTLSNVISTYHQNTKKNIESSDHVRSILDRLSKNQELKVINDYDIIEKKITKLLLSRTISDVIINFQEFSKFIDDTIAIDISIKSIEDVLIYEKQVEIIDKYLEDIQIKFNLIVEQKNEWKNIDGGHPKIIKFFQVCYLSLITKREIFDKWINTILDKVFHLLKLPLKK